MNSSISHAIGWCALQVSLVALAGIVLSMLASRRNSWTASAILCRAVVTCAILTTLAPLPFHRLFALGMLSNSSHPDLNTNIDPDTPEAAATTSPLDLPTMPFDNLSDLVTAARSMAANVDRFETSSRRAVQSVVWIMLAAIAIGHLRLAAGMIYIRQIRRSGTSIKDPPLLNLLHELATVFECPVPDVRESPCITDAAVAGWTRPTLVLPLGWRHWNDDELRVVIAHELAHIVQFDAIWRGIASAVSAIHFYNPLAHWLHRRVILCQELSADATAANVIGRRRYLHLLSSLAIEQDNRLMKDGSAGLLPVFSGHLMRRIKMLSSKDGRTDVVPQGKRSIIATTISAAFMAMGFVALATRGVAQPPADVPKATPNPRITLSFTTTASPVLDQGPKEFDRVPLSPSIMGAANSIGMGVIRVRELLKRPEINSYTAMLNQEVSSMLASELNCKTAPILNLECIEWIAVRPVVGFKAQTPEQKSQLAVGSGEFLVKLSEPIDLKQWFDRFAPDAPRHLVEGTHVFQLTSAAMGPAPFLVWSSDGMTIHLTGSNPEITPTTTLAELEKNLNSDRAVAKVVGDGPVLDAVNSTKWNATWNRNEGGLISVAIARANLSGLLIDLNDRPDFQEPIGATLAQVLRSMQSRCITSALGVDFTGDQSQIAIRCRFTSSVREQADQTAREIRELLTMAKSELAKEFEALKASATKKDDELRLVAVCIEALDTLTHVAVETFDDGTADVVVSAAVPFNTLLQFAALGLKDDSAED